MRYAIWYHLYNLKNVKNITSVTFSKVAGFQPATLLKVTLLHGVFHIFYIVQMVPNRAKHHICRLMARSVYDRYVCLPTSDEECQNEILVFRVYINN